MARSEQLGIKRIEAVHFYVNALGQARDYWVEKLDFAEVGRSSAEHDQRSGQRSVVVQAGEARYQLTESLRDDSSAGRYLKRHPNGVCEIIFEVDDAAQAFEALEGRGAAIMCDVERASDEGGTCAWFSIATAFGDVAFTFIQRRGFRGFRPGVEMLASPSGGTNRFGFGAIDHITSNFLTLKPLVSWCKQVLGLEEYWGIEFHTQDYTTIEGPGSGLKSVVLWDPHSGVKFANNEPLRPHFENSQIYLFVEDNRGPGVQHTAVTIADIVGTVDAMRERGLTFMPTPSTYYDALTTRLAEAGISIDEPIDELRRTEILVDGEGPGKYLLQIFAQDFAGYFGDPEGGPFFLEIIQRKGDRGFGGGNFRALFESIERAQVAEGRIDVLDRHHAGRLPPKHHVAFRDDQGALLHEECLTRQGFDGPYVLIYHQNEPHRHSAWRASEHGWAPPVEEDAETARVLRRRHFKTFELPVGGAPIDERTPMTFNDDVTQGVLRPGASDPVYFSNLDGDELFYVHSGGGVLRSVLGDVAFGPKDYIFVPRGIKHRFILDDDAEQYWVWFECRKDFFLPKQWRTPTGQLRMDAPFCHRDFRLPVFDGPIDEGIRTFVVKSSGRFTEFEQPWSPLDAVGWDGSVYPYAFHILDFQPRAGLVHLPPDWHGHFAFPGGIICSFVPRVVDFHPDAIPYPHESVHCDEFLFYSEGNFVSRRGIDRGSVSYHPRGIMHGPHPGAYEASIGHTRTDELAVMMDTFAPLKIAKQAIPIEDPDYHASWLP